VVADDPEAGRFGAGGPPLVVRKVTVFGASASEVKGVFAAASLGLEVPLKHQLLADARLNHYQHEYRQAVINACSTGRFTTPRWARSASTTGTSPAVPADQIPLRAQDRDRRDQHSLLIALYHILKTASSTGPRPPTTKPNASNANGRPNGSSRNSRSLGTPSRSKRQQPSRRSHPERIFLRAAVGRSSPASRRDFRIRPDPGVESGPFDALAKDDNQQRTESAA
jgi:hypothetical protein